MLKQGTPLLGSTTSLPRVCTRVGFICLCVMLVSASYPGANANHLETPDCGSQTAQAQVTSNLPSAALNTPIRLLSWNIQKSQTDGWDQDLKKIGNDRDILLIQEASVQAKTQGALSRAMHAAFAAGYTTQSQETGVLTLSAVAPSLQCSLTSWEPWLGTPKATSITKFPIANSALTLMVINLHAVNFTVGLEGFTHQIEAISPALTQHTGPALLAGDFNTWSEARKAHLEKFVADHQLRAVTFTPDKRSTFWDMPLDHIYLRGLRALEAQTVAVDTSDHNPLLVTLEI
ncbi:MAG: endonuclease/exonuclease/phosphatase (EEP) superfamily protein YafD, partial [Halioglobus sp.]